MMEKAVFFDIDGTLIDAAHGHVHMTAPVREAIRMVQAEGSYAFIASGRPLSYLSEDIQEFGFDGYVLMNGALVLYGDKEIFAEPLPRDIVRQTMALCDGNQVQYTLQGRKHTYLKSSFGLLRDFYRRFHIRDDAFVREFDMSEVTAYKMEFFSDNPAAPDVYEKLLQVPGMTGIIDPFHARNFEYYAAAQSKGSGIEHMLAYLGIPASQSYAFGDGENDMDMMDTVGTSLVMANGNSRLKKKATHIVPGVDEDGTAKGIKEYIL
jgi:Cof subfamily protein (haloacid dehalogenase superfamily)